MDTKQVFDLMKKIALYYDRFQVTKEKVAAWEEAFRDQDYSEVTEKLNKHVLQEKFPPTIAELITVKYAPKFTDLSMYD